MSEGNQDVEFLRQRYSGLAKSPEVTAAANRTKARTGIEVPKDPNERIQNFLDRFKEIVERPEPELKARGITALKRVLVDRYVVRVEDIPDSYWQAQLRVVRNRGESGDWQDLPEEEVQKLKQDHLSQSKEDQQGSIEEWIDYLASDKSSYLPDHLKYWAFAGMLRLERYEKAEKDEHGAVIKQGRFPERPTGKQHTAKMFPEVNENGLKFIASAYKQQADGKNIYWGYNQDIPEKARQTFLDALDKKDFRSAYGWVQEYIPPITDEEMQITDGDNCGWVTFSKEERPGFNTGQDVADTLSGKGTGWCIAGRETAQGNYLDQGAKLHICYTRDKNGNQTNPRVVIVEMGGKVTEVRGIEWEENVDIYMKAADVIGIKLKELPGGEAFFTIDADTKYLTTIDRKIGKGETLTGEELAFLYEVDRPIKYFGYRKDPRIEELRNQRNPETDMPIVFGCEPAQIARSIKDIDRITREGKKVGAYVGPLVPGIFDRLTQVGVEQIYASFPEGKIRRQQIEIGGKTREQLQQELKQKGVNVSSYAEDMMKSPDFSTLPIAQMLDTVRLKVGDLGLSGYPTTDQVYKKAQELGLDLCPPEVGPQYRLQYADQPLGEWFYVGMKQITDSDGNPHVFNLGRRDGGLWLSGPWAGPDYEWHPHSGFVFSLRKSETQNPQTLSSLLKNLLKR